MKWITGITLNNFRAFGAPETINIPKGNHLLIYGENGSGKSSIYYGLKDFFSSSVVRNTTTFKLNKFLERGGNTIGDVTVSFSEIENENAPVVLKFNAPPTPSTNNHPEIILANKFKGFLDYRRMLKVHSLEIPDGQTPNLFKLIVEELLNEHRVADPKGGTTTVEFFAEYKRIKAIFQGTEREYSELSEAQIDDKLSDIEEELDSLSEEAAASIDLPERIITRRFELSDEKSSLDNAKKIIDAEKQLISLNSEFEILLTKIENNANNFLQTYFKNKIQIQILYRKLIFNNRTNTIDESISLKIFYAGVEIEFYQAFLNESRLSSLAICLYLASIKTYDPEAETLKVLYLDDVFIGLDTTNRFPLLEIIKKEFIDADFQVFISTYDREWFELSRHWFQIKVGSGKIKSLELFIEDDQNPNTPDYPVVIPYDGNLAKANAHFKSKDYPAAGNYLRKECETIIKDLLEDTYKITRDGVLINDFEGLLNQLENFYDDSNLQKPSELTDAIRIYRKAILNPSSHSDTKSPLFKKELEDAFEIVTKLNALTKIRRTLVACKGTVFTYKNITARYIAEIELADNIWKVEYDSVKTFSKHKFRIIKWIWNGTDYATDNRGTVMVQPNRDDFCELKRTLAQIFEVINYCTGIAIPVNPNTEVNIGVNGTLNDLLQ